MRGWGTGGDEGGERGQEELGGQEEVGGQEKQEEIGNEGDGVRRGWEGTGGVWGGEGTGWGGHRREQRGQEWMGDRGRDGGGRAGGGQEGWRNRRGQMGTEGWRREKPGGVQFTRPLGTLFFTTSRAPRAGETAVAELSLQKAGGQVAVETFTMEHPNTKLQAPWIILGDPTYGLGLPLLCMGPGGRKGCLTHIRSAWFLNGSCFLNCTGGF